jgi:hypothetical protein
MIFPNVSEFILSCFLFSLSLSVSVSLSLCLSLFSVSQPNLNQKPSLNLIQIPNNKTENIGSAVVEDFVAAFSEMDFPEEVALSAFVFMDTTDSGHINMKRWTQGLKRADEREVERIVDLKLKLGAAADAQQNGLQYDANNSRRKSRRKEGWVEWGGRVGGNVAKWVWTGLTGME